MDTRSVLHQQQRPALTIIDCVEQQAGNVGKNKTGQRIVISSRLHVSTKECPSGTEHIQYLLLFCCGRKLPCVYCILAV